MSYSKDRILFTLCLALLSSIFCKAQYHPMYSQYMFNGQAINPAYAGSREVLSLAALYRSQGKNIEGAPVTQTFSGDFPLRNPQLALGLLVFNDQIGKYRQSGAYAAYAFRVKAGEGKLSFGLQAGFDMMREDNNVFTLQENDPMFNGEILKLFMPNVGAGVYYYDDNYFAGFSMPRLMAYAPNNADSYSGKLSFENLMLYGGTKIFINDNLKVKPSALIQYAQKTWLYDLNCNIILLPKETLELGISYRNTKTLVALAEVRINPQFCLGYSYDHTFGQFNITNGSHEIMLRYEFRFRVKAENPLYLK